MFYGGGINCRKPRTFLVLLEKFEGSVKTVKQQSASATLSEKKLSYVCLILLIGHGLLEPTVSWFVFFSLVQKMKIYSAWKCHLLTQTWHAFQRHSSFPTVFATLPGLLFCLGMQATGSRRGLLVASSQNSFSMTAWVLKHKMRVLSSYAYGQTCKWKTIQY